MLLQLDYAQYCSALRCSKAEEGTYVYDPIRRRHVALTPEEWLRQLVLQYLIQTKRYPQSRIGVEVGLTVNGMARRCDIVVFDRQVKPWLLVECKAPQVPLSQATFEQVARYNMAFQASFLAITNGVATFCAQIDYSGQTFAFLGDYPDYTAQQE